MRKFLALCSLLLIGMIATVNASPPGIDAQNNCITVQMQHEAGAALVAAIAYITPLTCTPAAAVQQASIVYDQAFEIIYLDPAEFAPDVSIRTCIEPYLPGINSTTTLSNYNPLVTPRCRAWVSNSEMWVSSVKKMQFGEYPLLVGNALNCRSDKLLIDEGTKRTKVFHICWFDVA